jgi:hypothetical protein
MSPFSASMHLNIWGCSTYTIEGWSCVISTNKCNWNILCTARAKLIEIKPLFHANYIQLIHSIYPPWSGKKEQCKASRERMYEHASWRLYPTRPITRKGTQSPRMILHVFCSIYLYEAICCSSSDCGIALERTVGHEDSCLSCCMHQMPAYSWMATQRDD